MPGGRYYCFVFLAFVRLHLEQLEQVAGVL